MMDQRARDPRPHKLDPTLLLAFVLPVFAWAPLTYPGYFVLRSGFLPIFNLADLLAHPGDLAWLPAVGAGYHLLGGDGALPYLVAAIPVALGAIPADAVKWVFALSFVMGSLGTYSWTRRRLRDGWPALVAAAVYVFSPISLPVTYARGAFASAVLLGLMPWVLWAADASAGGKRVAALLLALLAAACLWTQAAVAVAFLLIVLVYLLVLRLSGRGSPRSLAWAGAGLAGGVLLGVLGLLPAMTKHGAGAAGSLEASEWMTLIAPWLALIAGWIAVRLGAMLSDQSDGERAALFAALVALPLLTAYGDLQPPTYSRPIPPAPLAIFGDNEIALLSVQPEGTPGPNGRVAVDVEWQALKPLSRDYTVFFHVLGGNDQRYGQVDTMPQANKLPTTQWQPGEVVKDRYEAVLSPDAPAAGAYRYWLGWYLNETGQRLSSGTDDKYVVKP